MNTKNYYQPITQVMNVESQTVLCGSGSQLPKYVMRGSDTGIQDTDWGLD